MPTALHVQTQMTFRFDGEVLPTRLGFPLRIRMPTKLGFKNPKYVIGLAVLNNYTGGYWKTGATTGSADSNIPTIDLTGRWIIGDPVTAFNRQHESARGFEESPTAASAFAFR